MTTTKTRKKRAPKPERSWDREFTALLAKHGPDANCALQRFRRSRTSNESPWWDHMGEGPLSMMLPRFESAVREKRSLPTRLVRIDTKEPLFLLTHPPVSLEKAFDRAPDESDDVRKPEAKAAELGV